MKNGMEKIAAEKGMKMIPMAAVEDVDLAMAIPMAAAANANPSPAHKKALFQRDIGFLSGFAGSVASGGCGTTAKSRRMPFGASVQVPFAWQVIFLYTCP